MKPPAAKKRTRRAPSRSPSSAPGRVRSRQVEELHIDLTDGSDLFAGARKVDELGVRVGDTVLLEFDWETCRAEIVEINGGVVVVRTSGEVLCEENQCAVRKSPFSDHGEPDLSVWKFDPEATR